MRRRQLLTMLAAALVAAPAQAQTPAEWEQVIVAAKNEGCRR